MDALVCPALALPAFTHGASADLTPACSYTLTYNSLHYPAGVVPVTTVQENEQHYLCPEAQKDLFAAKARKECQDSAGLPVGVQIVSLPFQDEVALRVMGLLQAALARAC